MSDSWIRLIPADPNFIPPRDVAERARRYLEEQLPEADEVAMEFFGQIQFIDAGSNVDSVHCPRCRASLTSKWYYDAVGAAHASGFEQLDVELVCCGAEVSLNDLESTFPVGFARFVLDARNPNVADLGQGQIERIGSILGCRVRRILRHL